MQCEIKKLEFIKCKPIEGDENHWRSGHEGWAFNIYKTDKGYLAKIDYDNGTYGMGTWDTFDRAVMECWKIHTMEVMKFLDVHQQTEKD